MQQIVLPSLYDRRTALGTTSPFPLVRRVAPGQATHRSARKFLAGLLFGTLMSATLVLLGYEARLYADAHPDVLGTAMAAVRGSSP